MTPENTKCTAVTAAGTPCKAWAIRGSIPPLCAPHSGLTGAPKGNSNNLSHGFYARLFSAEEQAGIDEISGDSLMHEANLLRALLRRLARFLSDPDLPFAEVRTITPLIVSTSRALAFVQKQIPDTAAIDWDAVLDEVGEALDWDI